MKRLRSLFMVLALGIFGTGCFRHDTKPDQQIFTPLLPEVAKDGVRVSYRVFGPTETAAHPRLGCKVPATINSYGFTTQGDVQFALMTAPVFEVSIVNSTDHVLNMKDAVFKLLDTAGVSYDARSRDDVLATLDQAIAHVNDAAEGKKVTLDAAAVSSLRSAITRIKILDQNARILPNQRETYYLSFNIPVEATAGALDTWLRAQTTLTLGMYDVTTQTRVDGTTAVKSRFELPIRVSQAARVDS